jgi:SAM-dependent methyltransferase
MKDLFSEHASLYAAFRPSYPKAVYDFIESHVTRYDAAWDCATGNGQVAAALADRFHQVYATDISQAQLDEAERRDNIIYSIAAAEHTSFNDHQFDCITAAQAAHWFDLPAFYAEAKRVARPGALLMLWGYHVPRIGTSVDTIIDTFYTQTVGPYWDAARKLVDARYQSLAFPFEELTVPEFQMTFPWSLQHLQGYLSTWSATRAFMKKNGFDPVPRVMNQIKAIMHDDVFEVTFPLFARAGIIR